MNYGKLRKRSLSLWLCMFFVSKEAMACAVCFGNPNPKMRNGLFAAIYFLLGMIVTVLVGIVWTGFCWAKRAKEFEIQNARKGV